VSTWAYYVSSNEKKRGRCLEISPSLWPLRSLIVDRLSPENCSSHVGVLLAAALTMVAHLLNTVSLQTAFTQQNGDLTAKHEIDRVH